MTTSPPTSGEVLGIYQSLMKSGLRDLTPRQIAMLAEIPIVASPTGAPPKFTNAPTNKVFHNTVVCTLLPIMTIFVLNRVYVKAWLQRKFSWDDATLLLAILGTGVTAGASLWSALRGCLGKHGWDVSLADAISPNYLMTSYIIVVVTPVTLGLLKASFFILYLQLFGQLRWFRICARCGLALTTAFYIAVTIVQFYYASPAPGESFVAHGVSGASNRASDLAMPIAAFGLFFDIWILILPVAAISQIQTSLKKKLGALLVFCSGTLYEYPSRTSCSVSSLTTTRACVCAALSIYYRKRLVKAKDITWLIVPVITLGVSEMMIGIICACMPSFAYSYRHAPLIGKLRSSISSSMGSSNKDRTRTSQLSSVRWPARKLQAQAQKKDQYISLDEYSGATSSTNPESTMGSRV